MSGATDFNDLMQSVGRDPMQSTVRKDVAATLADRRNAHNMADAAKPCEGENPNMGADDESYLSDLPDPDFDFEALFEVGRNGIKGSVKNTELVLRNDSRWRGVLGFCDMSNRVVKLSSPPMPASTVGEWDADLDGAALRVWLAHTFKFTPSHSDIQDASLVVAKSNSFHPVRDYLQTLKWDGVPRLSTWLKQAFKASDGGEYLEIVGPKLLIGAVARVMRPGCKMESVGILEGEQGRGKSSVIRALFGEWFTDAPLPIGDKDAYQIIQGMWCLEIAELDSFSKHEVTALKQFFSIETDRYRPSYGRGVQSFHRQTVFWGSTNQDAYFRDYTGNRRYWPIYCRQINKAWVIEFRDQLWAEAYQLYQDGVEWWIDRNSEAGERQYQLAKEVQDTRLQIDPWEDDLIAWLVNVNAPFLSSKEILTDGLDFTEARAKQQAHMNRIGPIMQRLGWNSKRKWVVMPGKAKKVQQRVWVRPEEEFEQTEVVL